jgi:hypothetical protein
VLDAALAEASGGRALGPVGTIADALAEGGRSGVALAPADLKLRGDLPRRPWTSRVRGAPPILFVGCGAEAVQPAFQRRAGHAQDSEGVDAAPPAGGRPSRRA